MNKKYLTESLFNLIRSASSELPDDVIAALKKAKSAESKGSTGCQQLDLILQNISLAGKKKMPLCQDTGTLNFFVSAPYSFNKTLFRESAESAIIMATEKGILRKNSVSPLSGKNTGNNLGPGAPMIYWDEKPGKNLVVRLLLKGGGSENVGAQYSLPDDRLKAGRDIDGVRKCILDAVVRAQGKGCPPSIITVCMGGDRSSGYSECKKLFLKNMGERNQDPAVAALEKKILKDVNSLGIGPMGLGGKTFALELFISVLNRLPASYFVTVSQICWALRRSEIEIKL